MFLGLPGLAGFTFAGYHDRAHPEVVQGVIDTFLAVAAVGGDGAWRAPSCFMTRATAGASCGALAGLPTSTVWSSTIPSSLPATWALWPNSTG